MILLTKENQVVDIVKTAEIVENGLLVTRLDDNKLIYGEGKNFTQAIVETIPQNINANKLSDYEYINGDFILKKKQVYTKKEFLDKLTQSQVIAIWTSEDVNIKYFVAVLTMIDEIRLDSIETVAAITYMKDTGYITLEQYNAII